MDEIFKGIYEAHAFSFLPTLEPKWQNQVHHMVDLWEKIHIDKETFLSTFKRTCDELNLPHQAYDIEEAFEKVNGEWKEELMIATADYIVKWYVDVVDDGRVVALKNGRIVINDLIGQFSNLSV